MTEKEVEELYKIARFVIKKNNYPYSEDLVQEMVTVACEKMKNHYDETKSAKTTFLTMVMSQVYVINYRKENKNRAIPKNLIYSCDNLVPTAKDENLYFIDTIADEENNDNLRENFFKIINPLICVELKMKLEGLKEYEIAEKIGCTQPCVSRRIRNNIRDIKKYLEETEQYEYYKKLLIF